MQNQDFGSKKKLNFGLKNIYKGFIDGAEFKFDGLEMTSERNRKIWFERFENEVEANIRNSKSKFKFWGAKI